MYTILSPGLLVSAFLLPLLFISGNINGQEYRPDSTFSGDGTRETGLTCRTFTTTDEKHLVPFEGIFNYGVGMLSRDGSADTTFGDHGIARFSSYPFSPIVADMAADTLRQKIYLAVMMDAGAGYPGIALARATMQGIVDSVFGVNGTAFLPLPGGNRNVVRITTQADGKILLTGWEMDSVGYYDIFVVRTDTFGNPDNTFGTGGYKKYVLGPEHDVVNSIGVQTDGKIVLAGSSSIAYVLDDIDALFMRLMPDGRADSSFGVNGISLVDIYGGEDHVSDMFIQADGKIVAAGRANPPSNISCGIVLRLKSNGWPDSTFNGTGVRILSGAHHMLLHNVALAGGKYLCSGTMPMGDTTFVTLYRYDMSGMPDSTFNHGFYKLKNDTTDAASQAWPHTLQVDAGGAIFLAWTQGFLHLGYSVIAKLVPRYIATGTCGPEEDAFNIFPNPAGKYFITQIPAKVKQIQVTNMLGQAVFVKNITGESTVTIYPGGPGIYLVKLLWADRSVTKKVVVTGNAD